MTYFDILTLIEQRGEQVLTDTVNDLVSNQHHYYRQEDGDWVEDKEPGKPDQQWGRGGSYYVWKATTE
jgi:hypothetical protein